MSHSRLVNIDQLKNEITEALPISRVAERLCDVELEPRGDQWRGLCPLHPENTPSFYAHDGKGVYKCWGCKAGGDAIDLVRRHRNLEFVEALYLLAAEADVDIERYERPLTDAERQREELRVWCEAFVEAGGSVPDRVPNVELARKFGVFTVPRSLPPNKPSWLKDKERSYLLRAGSVLFPYRSPSGRLVGWKLRDADKRMVRTPSDFPLQEPALFGLHVAREHLVDGELTLVEGEYDALTCQAHGMHNVVGLGSSVFNDELMEILERLHIRSVVFLLDGDRAGQQAAHQIADRYWGHDVRVRVAVMPEGEDPDSFLLKYPAISLQLMVTQAKSALEWLLWEEWNKRERESLSSKLDFVSWIREKYGPRLRATEETLVLNEVADWMGLPEIDVQDFARISDASLQAVDSERVVISKAMRDQKYYAHARKNISASDFYLRKHQRIWEMLGSILMEGKDFDSVIIRQYAEMAGVPSEYVFETLRVTELNIGHHEDMVLDLSLRRAARDAALDFKTRIADTKTESTLAIGDFTHQITNKALARSGGAERQLSEQVDKAVETIHERMRNPDEIHGITLGNQLPVLSRTLQGLQARRFCLLAATSGAGKSTFCIQAFTVIGVHQSIPTDFISLEMDSNEVLFKMASHMTGIDSLAISGGTLSSREQLRQVEQAMIRIRKSPVKIHDPDDLTPSTFLLYAREQRMQRRSEVFFVDYVQLVSPDPGMERASGYEQYGAFSRMAKMKVARSMDCAVFCVAQLRRELADKERPTKEDMGDSYQIVRDADVILILSGSDESSSVDLWVDKNRQGANNVLVTLNYHKPTQTFKELQSSASTPDYLIAA